MKTLEQLCNEYQDYCQVFKSKPTLDYQLDQISAILRFSDYYKIKFPSDLEPKEINEFIKWSKLTCKNITINKRLCFLKQVLKHHHIINEYLFSIPKLKQELKSYDIIPEHQIKKLLQYVLSLDQNNPILFTEKIVILLLLDTGVRANELINIKIKNINLNGNIIKLETTKSKRERFVHFTKFSKPHLEEYMKLKPTRIHLLFNFRAYKPYTYRHLEKLMESLKRALDISLLHSHMFRHTMATLLVENGCPLSTVQQILGHKDLSQTQIYLHMSVKQASQDYEKYSYLNQ